MFQRRVICAETNPGVCTSTMLSWSCDSSLTCSCFCSPEPECENILRRGLGVWANVPQISIWDFSANRILVCQTKRNKILIQMRMCADPPLSHLSHPTQFGFKAWDLGAVQYGESYPIACFCRATNIHLSRFVWQTSEDYSVPPRCLVKSPFLKFQ